MGALIGNVLPKVHRGLHALRSLAMTKPHLTLLLLNLLLLNIQKKIYKKSSEQSLKPEFPPLTAPVKSHWNPDPQTYIIISLTWNATILVSNVKTTLLPLEPRALITYFLLICFFVTVSTSDGNNISGSKISLFQSPGTSSKRFFSKV